MKRITPYRPAFVACLAAAIAIGTAATAFAVQYPSNGNFASPIANSAVVKTRVFNDCPSSNLTVVSNYPAEISFDDANVDCFGFANLHTWSFSTDGVNAANFENGSSYHMACDFKIEGTGNGEGGLRISPWYGQYTDGLFNVRSTDGEIACFGGRLPFFSFSGAFNLRYHKGDVIHLEATYEPHGLSSGPPHPPATIEYRVTYLGQSYTSGKINFDQGNEAEDAMWATGQYGELNGRAGFPDEATRAGGHFKAFLGQGTPVEVKGTFTNIAFSTTPAVNSDIVNERVFNDCPSSNLTTVNNYPAEVSFNDQNVDCFGFANMHTWRFSDDGGANRAIFNNDASFRFSSDFKIEGSGHGEGGLSISPWYSLLADGLFNVRSTDGEIACFGGRLPFFTFSGAFGLRYHQGDPIHLEIIYDAHGRTAADPATVEYKVSYLGTDYTSGALPFDQGNTGEDALYGYGTYGSLNDGAAGGNFKAFLGQGNSVDVKGSFTNIKFSTCLHPADVAFEIKPKKLNTKSNGPWVTAYITPAAGIDASTLELNGVPAATDPAPSVNGNTLKVRFSRAAVAASVASGDNVEVVLTGESAGGCIESSSTIDVKGSSTSAPAAGAVLPAGSVADVVWDPDASANSVQLLASADNGVTWQVAVASVPNTGNYRWIVGNLPSSQARLAIASVYETDNTGIVTQSEYAVSPAFVITAPLAVGGGMTDFALRVPNPSSTNLNVSFSLATSAEAKLSVFDIAGREVVGRSVGGRAGTQSIQMGQLKAGVYVVKLSQAGRSLSNRVAIVN